MILSRIWARYVELCKEWREEDQEQSRVQHRVKAEEDLIKTLQCWQQNCERNPAQNSSVWTEPGGTDGQQELSDQ